MTKFNYIKTQNRIDKLNSLRDDAGKFTGTYKQLDALMDLTLYNRQELGHALCLDLKTDVTKKFTTFKYEDIKFGVKTYFLVVNGNPSTFELTDVEDNSGLYVDIKATGVLKSLYGDKETKYNVVCIDRGGCGCWFIQKAA